MLLLLGTACPIVDSSILLTSREYFPKAELYKFHLPMIHVETHVGNVTRKFVSEVFQKMASGSQGKQLLIAMRLSGYRWDTSTNQHFVLDATQYSSWFHQTFPSAPSGYQIIR